MVKIKFLIPIKELFTANYDPNTDEIKGCREGSMAYFHEYRHSLQMKNSIILFLWKWCQTFTGLLGIIMIWLILLTRMVKESLMLGGIFLLPLTLLFLFIELDAIIYSFISVIKKRFG